MSGLSSFPLLSRMLRVVHAHPDYSSSREGLKWSVFVLISLPAVYEVLLTVANAVLRPIPSSSSSMLVYSPIFVLGTVMRTFIPIFAYIFLIEYLQRTDHFDEYIAETTAINPAVPGHILRFARRLEIIFLIFIFPFYTMIEVLGVLLTSSFSDSLQTIQAFIIIVSVPIQVGLVTMATLTVSLLAFLHILDVNNYVSMLPATELSTAITEYTRISRALKASGRHTQGFVSVLILVSIVSYLVQTAHVVITGTATTGLTTLIFYTLMVVMLLRLAAWVTERVQGAIDSFYDEHGKTPDNELVQFLMKVARKKVAWRAYGYELSPAAFMLQLWLYVLFSVITITVGSSLMLSTSDPTIFEPFV